jgi:hypothetical protein
MGNVEMLSCVFASVVTQNLISGIIKNDLLPTIGSRIDCQQLHPTKF